MTGNGYGVSFHSDEKVLKLDSDNFLQKGFHSGIILDLVRKRPDHTTVKLCAPQVTKGMILSSNISM